VGLSYQKKFTIKLIGIVILMFWSLQATPSQQNTRLYELEYSNKMLNLTYKKILDKMNKVEQVKLRKSQRAWIIFRDFDCAWAFGAEPLDCMIDRTENRMKELQQTEFFDSNGDYLSIEK
jgi:uncharacterized protein YecT (DUF1311 family)